MYDDDWMDEDLYDDRDVGDDDDDEECEHGSLPRRCQKCFNELIGANEDGSCPNCQAEEIGSGPASCHVCVEAVSLSAGHYDRRFSMPGANSALRAAGPGNPRNLPCPSCGESNRLTPADVARGYQCDSCADMAERGGY